MYLDEYVSDYVGLCVVTAGQLAGVFGPVPLLTEITADPLSLPR